MKKIINSAADTRSRSRMSDDLDIAIEELISYANQIATRSNELTDMGLASVLEDIEKMTSTLRRDGRTYLPDKPQPQVSIESEIQGLASDMLYEEYDNSGGKYDEVEFEDIVDSVIDHVKWVVFELDDDNQHADVAVAFQTKPQYCEDLIRDYVDNKIDSYPWTVIR